jgi:hypothetical protein
MASLASSMKRTCAALVFGIARQHCRAFRPAMGIIDGTAGTGFRSAMPTTVRYSSSFQAPEPPQSKGQAVYSDINFPSISSDDETEASLRNNDPDAVFVVSGASRGIGLEFVNALLKRTKVGPENNIQKYEEVEDNLCL